MSNERCRESGRFINRGVVREDDCVPLPNVSPVTSRERDKFVSGGVGGEVWR